jgi:hypothetical protein
MMKRYFGAFALLSVLFSFWATAVCGAQNTTTFGNIVSQGTPCGSANCVYYQLPPSTPWVSVVVTGTWTGTLETAVTSAPNANYSNLSTLAWTAVTTNTANGTWTVATTGWTYLRVRATSWSGGLAHVAMDSTLTQAPLINPIFPGQSDGLTAPAGNTVVGNGAGTTSVTPVSQEQNLSQLYNLPLNSTSISNGLQTIGDSITCGIGAWPATTTPSSPGLGYAYLMQQHLGATLFNHCQSGGTASDLAYLIPYFVYPSEGANPLSTYMVGKNDESYGTTTANQQSYLKNMVGGVTWVAMPPSSRTSTSTLPLTITSAVYTPPNGLIPATMVFTLSAPLPGSYGAGFRLALSGLTLNTALNGTTVQIDQPMSNQLTASTNNQVMVQIPACSSCASGTETGSATPANYTFSGFGTQDNTTYLTGQFATSTTAGDTLTLTNYPIGQTGVLVVHYAGYQNGTGTATVSVDGAVQTDTLTASTTLNANQGTNIQKAFLLANETPVEAAVYTGLTPGLHTIQITNTSNALFGVLDVGSPDNSVTSGSSAPTVFVDGITPNAGEAMTGTTSYTINNWALNEALTLYEQGFNVYPVNVRRYINSGVDFSGDGFHCIASDLLPVHPGSCGHAAIARANEEAIKAAGMTPGANWTYINNPSGGTTPVNKAFTQVFQAGGSVVLGAVSSFQTGPVTIYNSSTSANLVVTSTGNTGGNLTLTPLTGGVWTTNAGGAWFYLRPLTATYPQSLITQNGGSPVTVACTSSFQTYILTGSPAAPINLPTNCPARTQVTLINQAVSGASAITGIAYGNATSLTSLANGDCVTLEAEQYSGAGGWGKIAGQCLASGGGSGTVNSGTAGQIAYYAANGTAVSGATTLPASAFPGLTGDIICAGGALVCVVDAIGGSSLTALPARTGGVYTPVSVNQATGALYPMTGTDLESIGSIINTPGSQGQYIAQTLDSTFGASVDNNVYQYAGFAQVALASANLGSNAATVTFTASSANIAGANTLGFTAPVQFSSTGTLPTGISAATTYYVLSMGNPFTVSATVNGSPIVVTSAGTGTITATAQATYPQMLTSCGINQTVWNQADYAFFYTKQETCAKGNSKTLAWGDQNPIIKCAQWTQPIAGFYHTNNVGTSGNGTWIQQGCQLFGEGLASLSGTTLTVTAGSLSTLYSPPIVVGTVINLDQGPGVVPGSPAGVVQVTVQSVTSATVLQLVSNPVGTATNIHFLTEAPMQTQTAGNAAVYEANIVWNAAQNATGCESNAYEDGGLYSQITCTNVAPGSANAMVLGSAAGFNQDKLNMNVQLTNHIASTQGFPTVTGTVSGGTLTSVTTSGGTQPFVSSEYLQFNVKDTAGNCSVDPSGITGHLVRGWTITGTSDGTTLALTNVTVSSGTPATGNPIFVDMAASSLPSTAEWWYQPAWNTTIQTITGTGPYTYNVINSNHKPIPAGTYTFYGNTPTSVGVDNSSIVIGNGGTCATVGTPAFTNTSPIIAATNTLAANNTIQFQTTGALPSGFAANTTYYVLSTGLSGSQFEVSATQGGTPITAGSAGSGTQSATVNAPYLSEMQIWPVANGLLDFESDAHWPNLYVQEFPIGVTVQGGASSFEHFHPTSNVTGLAANTGSLNFTDMECDTNLLCFKNNSSTNSTINFTGTFSYFAHAGTLAGATVYQFAPSGNLIKIGGAGANNAGHPTTGFNFYANSSGVALIPCTPAWLALGSISTPNQDPAYASTNVDCNINNTMFVNGLGTMGPLYLGPSGSNSPGTVGQVPLSQGPGVAAIWGTPPAGTHQVGPFFCTGLASSGGNMSAIGVGATAGPACSTSGYNGQVGLLMVSGGTASNLSARCGSVGSSTSSGTITLQRVLNTASGAVATSEQIILGTGAAGTLVQDTNPAHNYTYAAGTVLSILMTSAGSGETLGNCTFNFDITD